MVIGLHLRELDSMSEDEKVTPSYVHVHHASQVREKQIWFSFPRSLIEMGELHALRLAQVKTQPSDHTVLACGKPGQPWSSQITPLVRSHHWTMVWPCVGAKRCQAHLLSTLNQTSLL